jgi:hypothetical protein
LLSKLLSNVPGAQRNPLIRVGFESNSWCRGAESNCRHRGFQPRALPTELPRRRLIVFGGPFPGNPGSQALHRAGRADLDKFETAMRRDKRLRGYFMAFGFSSDATREIKRANREDGLDIVPITVKELLDHERVAV